MTMAYAVPEAAEVMDVAASFKVEQVWSSTEARTTQAVRVGPEAIWLSRMPGDDRKRFLWLEFTLPGTNQRIRALGEVLPAPDATVRWTCVRFKHLFPDQQRVVERFVSAHRPRMAA